MKKQVMLVPGVQAPQSPFNHVVRAGDFLFLTSQLAADLQTGAFLGAASSSRPDGPWRTSGSCSSPVTPRWMIS
jgi:hypothetical protein